MSNTFQANQIYTNEALRILKNKLILLKNVNRDNEHMFAKKGLKAGSTVNLRLPARYTSRSGETYSAVAYTETSTTCTVRPLKGVDIDLLSTDITLSLDNERERVLKPAMAQLANDIEVDCYQLAYRGVANHVGTAGTIPTTIKLYNQARALMVTSGTPDDNSKTLIISPDMQVEASAALSTVFNPTAASSAAYKTGMIGQGVSFDWYETANVQTHTVGTYGGTPLTAGTTTSGATSLVTDGWTATTTILNVGDTFTVAGVYDVNPMTRVTTGKLKNFVVTTATTTDGSGNSTIAFSPAMISSGAFQTVTAMPADEAAIVVTGASTTATPQGLAFHRDAFTWACINQEMPKGMNNVWTATDKDTGIQLRYISDFDAVNNKFINRFDVMYAFAAQYPQLACRIYS